MQEIIKINQISGLLLIFFAVTFSLNAQTYNKVLPDSKSGKPMLFGVCDMEAFQDSSFKRWYDPEYEFYDVDSTNLPAPISLQGVTFKIVFGSWCGDSKREVPRFIKMLETMNYDISQIELYAVDREKISPDGELEKLNVELVPTFFVFRNGEEIGRIVESPKKSLEEDLKCILLN
ncbi:MAG: thioredoxin family protein [Melioribacteraceae bacterium]|nr:thioredoxin family protein [Melioribacteraceae bacterium]